MTSPLRFAIETWAPEYGAGVEGSASPGTSEAAVVDVAVERAPADWAPIRPQVPPSSEPVRFVDGVRRIEARVWFTGDDGIARQGICASYGAGVVCCNHEAVVERTAVERAVFARADGASDIVTRHGTFGFHGVVDDAPEQLSLALQGAMTDLEHEVSVGAAVDGELLVVDGPLRDRHRLPGAVGMVKTHHRSYLPEPLLGVIDQLLAGERTPLLCIDGRASRWSWYLRLPGEKAHAWSGVVRCELAATTPLDGAVARADLVTATLPRFASVAHKDGRAPQNLFPIAGLERDLRRRLGDTNVLQRALRQAAREQVSLPAPVTPA